jgi:hypothetical protein
LIEDEVSVCREGTCEGRKEGGEGRKKEMKEGRKKRNGENIDSVPSNR